MNKFERREPCKAMFVSKCTHFAFSCSRAILADVFRGISKDSVPMVTGNLLHQVIQGVLVKWTESHNNGDDVSVTREDVEEMINPRRACAARVTVVVLCVCQCVQASHPLLTQLQDQVDIPTDSVSCSLQN